MKKTLSLLLVFVMLASFLVSCGGIKPDAEVKGAQITVYLGNEVRDFDPGYTQLDDDAAELMNLLYVGLVSTVLSLVITVLSAFAFARLEFKGKESLFGALLATMMIPGELFTITNYATVATVFFWTYSFKALIIPFLVSIFYIY